MIHICWRSNRSIGRPDGVPSLAIRDRGCQELERSPLPLVKYSGLRQTRIHSLDANLLQAQRNPNPAANREGLTALNPLPKWSAQAHSKFPRENILQSDFQLVQDGFQFVQGETMLAMLNAKKCLVRQARLFGELSVRKFAPFLSQKPGQLAVEIALHGAKNARSIITYA